MNIINVRIDFEKGLCQSEGISVITGDYNSTKMVFDFIGEPEGTKIFKLKDPKDQIVFVDEIVDNEIILVGKEEVEGEEQIFSVFGEVGDYVFEVSLYGEDSRLTSVCDYIRVNQEQIIVGDDIIQGEITLFDNMMQALSAATEEADNLDVDVEKELDTATITITKKDGTTKSVEIQDGRDGRDGVDGTNGTNGVDGKDGRDGVDGRDGAIQYTAGENITIENNVISAVGSDVPTSDNQLVNKKYVDDAIGGALGGSY